MFLLYLNHSFSWIGANVRLGNATLYSSGVSLALLSHAQWTLLLVPLLLFPWRLGFLFCVFLPANWACGTVLVIMFFRFALWLAVINLPLCGFSVFLSFLAASFVCLKGKGNKRSLVKLSSGWQLSSSTTSSDNVCASGRGFLCVVRITLVNRIASLNLTCSTSTWNIWKRNFYKVIHRIVIKHRINFEKNWKKKQK